MRHYPESNDQAARWMRAWRGVRRALRGWTRLWAAGKCSRMPNSVTSGPSPGYGHRSATLKVIASNGRILIGASSFALAISRHCPSGQQATRAQCLPLQSEARHGRLEKPTGHAQSRLRRDERPARPRRSGLQHRGLGGHRLGAIGPRALAHRKRRGATPPRALQSQPAVRGGASGRSHTSPVH